MNLTKYIGTALVLGALASGCERGCNLDAKANEPVEWGLPEDCHVGHACGGEPINGLVRAEDCHAGHFCGSEEYTIYLPKGQTPTEENYKQVVEERTRRIAEHRK